MSCLAGTDGQPDREVGLAGARSEGDRLQQLRAVLPCEVRVVAETHPLFGRLLAAKSFKRWNGVLLLVIDLPDGSPGTIRCGRCIGWWVRWRRVPKSACRGWVRK